MLRCAGASAVLADGEGFRFGAKLLIGQLQTIFLCQMAHDGKIALFIGLLEGDGHAKAGRKAHQLLQSIIQVDIVAAAFAHGLFHQMAAVAGGVNHSIFRTGGHAALQCGFQSGKMLVIPREAQIINKDDEFQRIFRKQLQQGRQAEQLAFLYFDQPQTLISGKR